jgi:hypothetical protein
LICFFLSFRVNAQVTFCGEKVPVDNEYVKYKLLTTIRKNKGDIENKRLQDKINLYFPFFEATLKQYDLPDDLKYIALVESRLNPYEKSAAGATGIWQLMNNDAKDFGMTDLDVSNSRPDERNSVIKSTHTACREFVFLYKMYKDWAVVCAAYNFGLGNINKTIRKQGTSNYYEMRLNKETADYVYEIISFKILDNMLRTKGAAATIKYYETEEKATVVADTAIISEGLTVQVTVPATGTSLSFKRSSRERISEKPLRINTDVRGAVIKNTGSIIYINISESRVIGGYTIKSGAIVKAYPYATTDGRLKANIEGVEISKELMMYDAELCDIDGYVGIKGGSKNTDAGYRVLLRFTETVTDKN